MEVRSHFAIGQRGRWGPEREISGLFDEAATLCLMTDRRRHPRLRVDLFFNKFLDGHPYLCRAVDLSEKGLLAVTYTEPEIFAESFPLELRLPGQKRSVWVWARTVRRTTKGHAIEFVRMDPRDRRDLDSHLDLKVA